MKTSTAYVFIPSHSYALKGVNRYKSMTKKWKVYISKTSAQSPAIPEDMHIVVFFLCCDDAAALEAQLTGKAARGRARHVARYRQLEKLFWLSAAGPGRPTPDVAAAPALLATAKNNRTVHSWVNDAEFLSCTRDHMPFVLASFAAGNLRPSSASTASGSDLFHNFHNLILI